jgi:allantoinase
MNPLRTMIRSTRVVTPAGIIAAVVHIEQGKIVDVTADVPAGATVEEAGDLVLMPGLVDSHVHINEPGRTEWEGFATATRAAAAGGITTLVDMPLNSSPVTTTAAALESKRAAAEGAITVDCGFYSGLVPAESARPLLTPGVLGIKAFLVHSGIDEFPAVSEADLRRAMPAIARSGKPLLVHCELATDLPASGPPGSYRAYLASRPRSWEQTAISLMIRLAAEYGCKLHIVHVSSSDALPLIEEARAKGLAVTAETCPHYLTFSAEEIGDGDTRYKCAPPIRERENRERLWEGLRRGVLDGVVSDHSPSPPAMKIRGDFRASWGGIASLQFGLPIVWTGASERGFTCADLARWMCTRPAEWAGLGGRKGKIAPGFDADLVLWDPEASFTVKESIILHRHKLTPYEGRVLRGRVERTILAGRTIVQNGVFPGPPSGNILADLSQRGTHR